STHTLAAMMPLMASSTDPTATIGGENPERWRSQITERASRRLSNPSSPRRKSRLGVGLKSLWRRRAQLRVIDHGRSTPRARYRPAHHSHLAVIHSGIWSPVD